MPKYPFDPRKAFLAYSDFTERLSEKANKATQTVAKRPRISTRSPQLVASYNPNMSKGFLPTITTGTTFPISQIAKMQPTRFDPFKSTLYPSHPSTYETSSQILQIPDYYGGRQYRWSDQNIDRGLRYANLMNINGGGDPVVFEKYTMPALDKALEQAARYAGVPGTKPVVSSIGRTGYLTEVPKVEIPTTSPSAFTNVSKLSYDRPFVINEDGSIMWLNPINK